ncbi:hypothetical protein [Methanopyrus sp.]
MVWRLGADGEAGKPVEQLGREIVERTGVSSVEDVCEWEIGRRDARASVREDGIHRRHGIQRGRVREHIVLRGMSVRFRGLVRERVQGWYPDSSNPAVSSNPNLTFMFWIA